jgi:chitin disaccharide deacetylase
VLSLAASWSGLYHEVANLSRTAVGPGTELAAALRGPKLNEGARRHLIVNADDFGQSAGINRGIVEAFEHGMVTSASLMVRWPAAEEAAAYARSHPKLSVGLHLDFSEWVYHDGEWRALYRVVPDGDAQAIGDEAQRQLLAFRRLLGRDPTHVDSHQHAHLVDPTRPIVLQLARSMRAPVRHFCQDIRYCGEFYGQNERGASYPSGISVEGLLTIVRALPEGITELGCHPGYAEDLDSVYRDERLQELRTLCDPRARTALDEIGVELHSFSDVPRSPDRPSVAN